MQTVKTQTGFQLDNLSVDTKPHSKLARQQARTLLFAATGLSQKEIAREMGVQVSTVKKACNDLSFKFNTHSIRQTVHSAIKEGVLRYTFAILLCLFSGKGAELESEGDELARAFRLSQPGRAVRAGRNNRLRRLRELQIDLMSV